MSRDNGEGHMDAVDEGEDVTELDTVEFEDEEGNLHMFVILAIAEHEGSDYAMLAPEVQLLDEDGDELELYLFQVVEEDGEELFTTIEDDATYAAVREFFDTLMDSSGLTDAEVAEA